MDQYPYREDGYGAIKSSVLYLQKLEAILESVGVQAVEELIKKRDPIATSEFIRSSLINTPWPVQAGIEDWRLKIEYLWMSFSEA